MVPPIPSAGSRSGVVRLAPAIFGVFASLVGAVAHAQARAADAYIARSNAHAKILTEAEARFEPEFASFFGIEGYDDLVRDLGPGAYERERSALMRARQELERRARGEHDPRILEDLSILGDAATQRIRELEVRHAALLEWIDAPELVFHGLSALLRDDVPAERRRSALARLRRYVGTAPGSTSAFVRARQRFEERRENHGLAAPIRRQVERGTANAEVYVRGIRALFGENADAETRGLLDRLQEQIAAYTEWSRAEVLPRTRADARTPPTVYLEALRSHGIDVEPGELVRRARLAFIETRSAMQALAPHVAKGLGLESTGYHAVIRALKQRAIAAERVEEHYREVLAKLEAHEVSARVISLPKRAMSIRLATDSENAASPAPHFLPPPLTGAPDAHGVFVLTHGGDGASASPGFDDFTFPAAAWTLTAHEGRPGHELQFAAMLERGVPLARSRYAFNSVNVEGWALYAESEVMDGEPLEAQLIALQHRLLRAARAILDPSLNLGWITRAEAERVLRDEVMLSEAMTRQELDRYTFGAPGQACAYYYGYTQLLSIRMETELALGAAFDRLAFNDFVVQQGLLPPKLLAKAVREGFVNPRVEAVRARSE